MNKMKRKKIIIPIIIIILIGLAVSVLPWWSDIDITLRGIQFRNGDGEYAEEKTINIRGRYWRYLFRADRYEGKIEIEGYDFTFEEYMIFSIAQNDSTLHFQGNVGGNIVVQTLGIIYFKPVFSEVLIMIYDRGEGLFYISAPAGNREQALDIAKELENWNHWE